MLKSFLGSKIRRNLLKIFFTNSEKEFYTRELIKMLDTSPGNVHKELKKLESEKILNTNRKANLCFYKANKEFFLYKELESIVTKTVGIEAEIKKHLKAIKGLEFALIYGSYAKGDFKIDSDIDVFIIGDVDEIKVLRACRQSSQSLGREVNFNIENKNNFIEKFKENLYFQDVISKCVLLTDNENEFREFVKEIRSGGKNKKAKK